MLIYNVYMWQENVNEGGHLEDLDVDDINKDFKEIR
jgi:hypothetical protein